MGARTLRILISFALVFGVFLYLASLQLKSLVPEKSEEEGILGGPIPGLTRWQLAKFKEGKDPQKFTETKGARTLDQTDHGAPVSYTSEVTDKDFVQATALWQLLAKQDGAQERFVKNVSAHIAGVQREWLRKAAYGESSSQPARFHANASQQCSLASIRISGAHSSPIGQA